MAKKHPHIKTQLEVLKEFLPFDIVNYVKDEMHLLNRENELNKDYLEYWNKKLILGRLFDWETSRKGFRFWSEVNNRYFINSNK